MQTFRYHLRIYGPGYGDTEEQYLTWGREDVSAMLNALKKAGASPELFTKVLDLGCASGRMLRFYPNQSDSSELWGVDVSAPMISWSQLHFPRPFLFATTTTFPHLPFEDNYFDLVYASSVFTHISDLADSWLLECRRVMKNGGYAYITIHDKTSVDLLMTERKINAEFNDAIRQFDNETSVLSKDYASFSYVRAPYPYPQIFYDTPLLVEKWSRFAKVLSVTPKGHGCYQTAILLRK